MPEALYLIIDERLILTACSAARRSIWMVVVLMIKPEEATMKPITAILSGDGFHRPTSSQAADRRRDPMRPKRLRCLYLACAVIVTLPALAAGQSTSTSVPRIGVLAWAPCEEAWLSDISGPFLRGLGELGYKPGENVTIECRSAEGRYEDLATAATDLDGSSPSCSSQRRRL